MEWVLEVVTTATGAEEPYDYTRLAWLGDADTWRNSIKSNVFLFQVVRGS